MTTQALADIWTNAGLIKVIERAIEVHHQINEDDIAKAPKLRTLGEWAIDNYQGSNSFVKKIQLDAWNGRTLSKKQIAACLHALVVEYREHDNHAHQDCPMLPNGFYTVISDESANYRTIRLDDCPERYGKPQGTQMASFLTGPDNESDYTAFAFVYPGRNLHIFNRFKSNKQLQSAINVLINCDDALRYGEAYALESRRCWRCHRHLTVDVSIYSGLGPHCAKLLGVTRKAPPRRASECLGTVRDTSSTILIDNGDNDELF